MSTKSPDDRTDRILIQLHRIRRGKLTPPPYQYGNKVAVRHMYSNAPIRNLT